MDNNIKVLQLGKYATDADMLFYSETKKALNSNASVGEVATIYETVKQAYINGDTAFLDTLLEKIEVSLDQVDAVVLTSMQETDEHSKVIGWVIGYCYSIGKPVLLVSGNSINTQLPFIIVRSIHAHIIGTDKLSKYDFSELPQISYKGDLI